MIAVVFRGLYLGGILAFLLRYEAVAVGIEEFLQGINLHFQFLALVGVGHAQPVLVHFHNLRRALDVRSLVDGVLGRGERLVLYQLEAPRVVDQRVARNARLLVVGLRESAVDHHQFSIGLDGILAAHHMHGDVAVDDVAVGSRHSKLVHNHLGGLFFLAQREVVALFLLVGLLFLEEVAFEGCHLGLVEQWAVGSAPKVEEIVDGVLVELVVLLAACLESRAHHHTYII